MEDEARAVRRERRVVVDAMLGDDRLALARGDVDDVDEAFHLIAGGAPVIGDPPAVRGPAAESGEVAAGRELLRLRLRGRVHRHDVEMEPARSIADERD